MVRYNQALLYLDQEIKSTPKLSLRTKTAEVNRQPEMKETPSSSHNRKRATIINPWL